MSRHKLNPLYKDAFQSAENKVRKLYSYENSQNLPSQVFGFSQPEQVQKIIKIDPTGQTSVVESDTRTHIGISRRLLRIVKPTQFLVLSKKLTISGLRPENNLIRLCEIFPLTGRNDCPWIRN